MTVYFSSLVIEWYNGTVWVDLTADAMREAAPRGSRGITSTDINARVGAVGKFTIVLDNSAKGGLEGRYTPGHANCISGNWGKPYDFPIRVVCGYDGTYKYLWYGTFEPGPNGLTVMAGKYGERKVTASFRDWMGLAQERKLNLLPAYTYQRTDQAVQIILDQLEAGELPQTTQLNRGDSAFLAVFDDTNSGTTVYTELDKLAKSELGYIYVKADRTTGECLTVENRNLRWQAGGLTSSGGAQTTTGTLLLSDGFHLLLSDGDNLALNYAYNSVSRVGKLAADCGTLLLSNGDHLLLSNGDNLKLSETQDATFDETDIQVDGFQVRHFDNAFQCARISQQQKERGASNIVLWAMESPLAIGAGKTLTGVRGRYRDPSGGASYINAWSFVTLVSGTDYVGNSEEDGSGSNTTANLSVTANTGAAEVEFTIHNSGAACYVTTLQIRGKGIFSYDSLDTVLGDDTGKKRLDINLHYETNGSVGRKFATDITRIPDGVTTIQAMPLLANRDSFNMKAFMDLDIGSLYSITETMTCPQQDSPYFINGYEFTINWDAEGHPLVMWTVNGYPYNRTYSPS